MIDTLPPNCSGSPMPETEMVHHFKDIYDTNRNFELSDREVTNIVIKDPSSIEEITKRRIT